MRVPQCVLHILNDDRSRMFPDSIPSENNTSAVDCISHTLLSALAGTQQGREWSKQVWPLLYFSCSRLSSFQPRAARSSWLLLWSETRAWSATRWWLWGKFFCRSTETPTTSPPLSLAIDLRIFKVRVWFSLKKFYWKQTSYKIMPLKNLGKYHFGKKFSKFYLSSFLPFV